MHLPFCIPSSWSLSGGQGAEIPVQAGALLHHRCKPTHFGDVFGQEGPMAPGCWQMCPTQWVSCTKHNLMAASASLLLHDLSQGCHQNPRMAIPGGGGREVPQRTKCHIHHGLPSSMTCGARMGLCAVTQPPSSLCCGKEKSKNRN